MSACVMYDPPMPGLPGFAEVGAAELTREQAPKPARSGPDYTMAQAPIVQLKDANRATKIVEKFYEGIIDQMIDKYLIPAGYDPAQVLDDVLFIGTPEAVERWRRREQAELENEARPYIKASSHNTEADIQNARRILAADEDERPRSGRDSRDLLLNVECAILKDRFGWTVEKIAKHYGWQNTTRPGKPIKEGRQVLKFLSETK